MRRNDKKVIKAVAQAAGLPPQGFVVEDDHGVIMVNHPDSMTWTDERRKAVAAAATQLTGQPAAVS